MGRRKSKRKPPPKKKMTGTLETQFTCPFCNHEKSCDVKMDRARNTGGKARTQSPATTNDAVEFPAFGEIAGVSTPAVQWMSLTMGKPPSRSWYLPYQKGNVFSVQFYFSHRGLGAQVLLSPQNFADVKCPSICKIRTCSGCSQQQQTPEIPAWG
ncbi:TNFAIP3-interacting protein 1 [Platysternon megacephalum]|uniref:Transcription elongation factor 1 homolog n=1 Tax=Platysternon megacephalum TaxID=55544 RepID=A0A4D9E349_9SAUR|nr:TNFAIP3-interacting protein 1 [Platysternon megacephalum]